MNRPGDVRAIRLAYPVPYHAQVASPELAYAIFHEGQSPTTDPRWAETGARTPEEYAYWVDRGCGIACVKMAVEALGGPVRPFMDWVQEGLERKGYLVTQDEQGNRVEQGWVHRAMAEMIAHHTGLPAVPCPASTADIAGFLCQGRLVIASVSYELGDDLPITRDRGHLVVVIGVDLTEDGTAVSFYIHNPSGRRKELQAGARIEAGRFALAYSERAIVIG